VIAVTAHERASADLRGAMLRRALTILAFALVSLVGATPAVAQATCGTSTENEALWRINQERARNGLAPYLLDVRLGQAARLHSQDMAARAYFSHVTPEGVTFDQRIVAAGYPSPGGETIAAGYPTPAAAIDAWMNSPGHRAILLHATLRHFGLGIATGGPYGIYWTATFGQSTAPPDNLACTPGQPGKPAPAGSGLAAN
jgi:uncharacterized protein YkwD